MKKIIKLVISTILIKVFYDVFNENKFVKEQIDKLKEEVTNPPIPDAANVTRSINPKDKYLLFIVIMRYNLSCLKTRKKFGLQEQVLE